MGIGGISDYSNLFYNYKVPEIPAVDLERLTKKTEAISESDSVAINTQPVSQDIDLTIEEVQPKREMAKISDISLTFNTGEDYGYIGRDSDINSLDMKKAISGMKKDQVLQQYQYFVGDAQKMLPYNAGEDGLVFLKY